MSRDPRIARRTPVSVSQSLLAIEPLTVGLDDDLLDVLRRSMAQPATRLLGVIDERGVLVGVVPVLRLAEAIIARVVPEALLSGIADIADVAEFGHAVEARRSRDVMLPPATIRPESTVADAFREMRHRHLSGLYVVDDAGRPIGYLDLLELTLVYVDALDAERGEDPGVRPPTADATPDDPVA